MRRGDRAVLEQERILSFIEKCKICCLAFGGGEYPYVIPLNFGEKVRDGKLTLYFHGAGEGLKYQRLREDNRVAFSMYVEEELVIKEPACSSTMLYESVCGKGRAFLAETVEEKLDALKTIMLHYAKDKQEFEFAEKAVEKTSVIRVEVEAVTGKTNRS